MPGGHRVPLQFSSLEQRQTSCHCRLRFATLASVKATPGTLQGGGASFATTHWSVVAQAALTDVPEAADALAKLCEMYWQQTLSGTRSFLVAHMIQKVSDKLKLSKTKPRLVVNP